MINIKKNITLNIKSNVKNIIQQEDNIRRHSY